MVWLAVGLLCSLNVRPRSREAAATAAPELVLLSVTNSREQPGQRQVLASVDPRPGRRSSCTRLGAPSERTCSLRGSVEKTAAGSRVSDAEEEGDCRSAAGTIVSVRAPSSAAGKPETTGAMSRAPGGLESFRSRTPSGRRARPELPEQLVEERSMHRLGLTHCDPSGRSDCPQPLT